MLLLLHNLLLKASLDLVITGPSRRLPNLKVTSPKIFPSGTFKWASRQQFVQFVQFAITSAIYEIIKEKGVVDWGSRRKKSSSLHGRAIKA